MTVTWFTVPAPPSGKRLPKWYFSVARSDKTGEIFLPVVVAGNPTAVFYCASYDGVTVILDEDDHPFVPAQWLKREYPAVADIVDTVERRLASAPD
jgi:hypothetical protein